MKLADDMRIKVERDRWDDAFSVLVAGPPYNSWLNVPVTFATEDGARRVADAIRHEAVRGAPDDGQG